MSATPPTSPPDHETLLAAPAPPYIPPRRRDRIDRGGLLDSIRAALKAGGGRVTLDHFLAASSLRKRDLSNHFATWEAALLAAGCDQRAHNAPVDSARLLEDWGAVADKLRGIPTVRDYILHGSHTEATFSSRFGSWSRVPAALRAYAARKPRWKRVLKYVARSMRGKPRPPSARPIARRARPGMAHRRARARRSPLLHRRRPPRLPRRPVCGEPLHCWGPLHYAPTNEQGVVFLFGKLAERLGFFVLGLQTAFPDCTAMREITPGNWQPVTIEFEFESKNFRTHRHDPAGCDLIVCWEHNWPEYPENLEVIALREHVTAMQPNSFANAGAEKSNES